MRFLRRFMLRLENDSVLSFTAYRRRKRLSQSISWERVRRLRLRCALLLAGTGGFLALPLRSRSRPGCGAGGGIRCFKAKETFMFIPDGVLAK